MAGAEVHSEGEFFVGVEIPAGAVECVAFDARDADALPTEPFGLPCFAIGSPCEQSMEAGEEEKVLRWERTRVDYRYEGNVRGALGVQGIDDVGIASGDGADFVGIGAGKDTGGHREIGEAECARGEEVATACRMDEKLECTASESVLFAGDLLRIGELASGSDEWWSFEDLGSPGAGRRRRIM